MDNEPRPVIVSWHPITMPEPRRHTGLALSIRTDVVPTVKPKARTPKAPDPNPSQGHGAYRPRISVAFFRNGSRYPTSASHVSSPEHPVSRTLAVPSLYSSAIKPAKPAETRRKRTPTDRRYGLGRWRRLRPRILSRDGYRCRVVPGCGRTANVVDHIEPVTPQMPDSLFFDERNLRASCARHNQARGWKTYAERELRGR